jgi:hypothetical protein
MLVTIASYSFPLDAHISKSRLDSEDIPSFIADEHTIAMQWMYSNAMGGVRLQVPEEYVEQALEVLAEDRSQDLIDEQGYDSEICPVCGSTDVEFYQFGKRWAFVAFWLFSFPLFRVSDGIKCNSCGVISKT